MAKRRAESPLGTSVQKRHRLDSLNQSSIDYLASKHFPKKDTGNQNPQNPELCGTCSKIDLKPMFKTKVEETFIGYLDDFKDELCPFCSLIWAAIHIHWADEKPEINEEMQPLLFLSKQRVVDLSKKGRQENDPPRFQPRTRRTNRWNDRNLFILAELELASSTTRHAPRRAIGPVFDTKLAVQWLEDSKTLDDIEMKTKTPIIQYGFRVIDVLEECLVQKPELCQYLALSYVWGNLDPPAIITTKSNVVALSQPKSLSTESASRFVGKRLPRTIRDAIKFTRNIGQRYLWVDALCIIQDDIDEKRRLIHGMNHVYENAILTLIAASGIDAEAGLPGVTSRTNFRFERKFSLPTTDGTLKAAICRPCLIEQIRASYWNTRGWTYQEMCLSRRHLYFTQDEVFFQGSGRDRREGYSLERIENLELLSKELWFRYSPPWWNNNVSWDPDPLLVPSLPYMGQDYNYSSGLNAFASAVSDYSIRELRYSEDILNAFTGIYRRFSKSKNGAEREINISQGIPAQFFPEALYWFPAHSTNSDDQINKRPGISTWSWASLIAPIDFIHVDNASYSIVYAMYFRTDYSFVDKWYLCDGSRSRKYRTRDEYLRKPRGINLVAIFTGKTVEQGREGALLPATLTAGELGFRAPCLSVPFEDVFDFESEFEWIFKGRSGIFRFDTKYEKVDEFILISRFISSNFVLGVKNKAGISRRVGFGILPSGRVDWADLFDIGLAKIKWRFVRLK
ncbi:uncharacterized protein K452DRAFT_361947 [Aplosporella prunicola CBS 121167]|uniref:Heterokaryon incompatibility domain-containing protein n=1 Tax=Aplosporella prunicola CBS 121167 TaxID=1176127 RepID=A0A6A6B1G7_9PEZI|nr:uncharacterized protein K452DRAFT_361947 [Aplosporella prunicola CBS 121167]KAF2137428.1 hypothetical protein K452DRAFT_361947 [Aplosporella prunicola CBS 121167]